MTDPRPSPRSYVCADCGLVPASSAWTFCPFDGAPIVEVRDLDALDYEI